ncbi:DNA mismatch repair protein MutS, C-terminal domain and DNA mismatch repair protein MutS, core domain and DNA mismatch repair protein MutS, clamp domain and P-loop containing nucleoside triphosphate hydrolase domain-containing protein [Strongyloides ratti]|uniref:DNA_MISMATCH_REPAIR_2 domain-containing protein n=1 Tax=Strongyloides ratti TaxID=34506 RepID=A0A090MUA9_STRRB|nr:DNA mismatch repair protein MutS, C-terminal domain and DNA mismatch repair protein MutS, core domain and DNA mismatch repair protein MutS, clamp domain and P-loop containing nucleoside triphosphate hydrolase domain-containing protein [Strongyloides ratti]CEF62118.1 DNA mismatch repair protein MutS, C-terminal domain and DNA mismatch repair protein MutS, core domain and DNA mismatch repair protein MutS, clamp domain and P-loop containing nucleoside triphosphate hydrolase domain-containing prote
MEGENDSLFNILREKPSRTVLIFEGKDGFYLYGEDAFLAAEQIFGTDSLMDFTTLGKSDSSISRYFFVANQYEKVIHDLLIRLQYSVKHYVFEMETTWNLLSEGTPTYPNDFDYIVGETAQLASLSSTISVKLTNAGQFNELVEVAFCTTKDFSISTFVLPYDVNFQNLEHIIIILAVKEVFLYKDDMDAIPNIFKKLESVLLKIQVEIKLIEDTEMHEVDEAKKIITNMTSNIEESQLSDSMIVNLYVLLGNMDVIRDFSYRSGLLQYKKYSLSNFVVLDSAAIEALELFNIVTKSYSAADNKGTVFSLLNHCRTPGGSRLLEEWLRRPLINVSEINKRQDVVEALRNEHSVRNLLYEDFLRRVPDSISISRRLIIKKTSLKDCVEIFRLASNLKKYIDLFEELISSSPDCQDSINSVLLNPLKEIEENIKDFVDIIGKIVDFDALANFGDYRIVPDVDESLGEVNVMLKNLEQKAKREFSSVQNEIDDTTLKIECGEGGFTIKINPSGADLVAKAKYRIIRNTKATGCVFVTDVLDEINEKYSNCLKIYKEREAAYVGKILEKACENTATITNMLDFVAQIDVFVSLAVFATSSIKKFVRPNILTQDDPEGERVLKMKELRHPVVESSPNINYIPNDVELSSYEGVSPRFLLITGANMGGKSTYLRSVALGVLLGQIGCPVPCDEATYTIFDGIYTRIGARDYQEKGISTFMDEMLDCRNIIYGATPNSLVVVDELGRGTSTFDGIGLAYATAEELIQKECFTLYATHYFELLDLKEKHPYAVECLRADCAYTEENELISLFKMVPGITRKSFGLDVARTLKLPEDFLKLASSYYSKFSVFCNSQVISGVEEKSMKD